MDKGTRRTVGETTQLLTRVNIQPRASADADEAAAWYEAQQAGLGVEFVLELDSAIERAAETPEIYAIQYRNARRVLLRRFPFAVYFMYEGGVVEIFAVLHQRRQPALWRSRVQ